MATENNTSSAVSGQKKRALEALERRFAVAKPQIINQQHKSKKNEALQEGRGVGEGRGEGVEEAPFTSLDPPSFSKKDEEAQHPAYLKLLQPVHENLVSPGMKISTKGVNDINRIVHHLLQSGDSAQKYMQGSRRIKVDNWLLLDRFVPKNDASISARVKAVQSHSKRSKRHMSLRQHRKCGSFDLPENFHKFELFKPMHEMWKEYILELLKATGKNHLAQSLLSADLHGAILLVVECKTIAFVGIHGIMIRETAETFGIITEENKFRVVPKKGSVFIFKAGSWKITLYGDMLSSRNLGP